GESAADHRLPRVPKQRMQQPARIVRRPGQGNSWLEVVLVPVVHGLSAVDRPGFVDYDWFDEVIALCRRRKALLEICPEGNGRLHLESLGFIHGAFEAVEAPKSASDEDAASMRPGS